MMDSKMWRKNVVGKLASGQPFQLIDAGEGYPGGLDVNVQRELIGHLWPIWAAHAYDGCLSKGRGVVAVNLDVDAPQDTASAHEVTYVAEGSREFFERGGWPDERIAGMVKRYDPETQIVVVFVRPGGWVDAALATAQGTRPTPKQVYDHRNAA